MTIDENLGIDVDIVPNVMDNSPMRDFSDNNGIWSKTVKII
jgi:hypothetical protein